MGTSVLDQLHEALDALAGLDPDTLDDATVLTSSSASPSEPPDWKRCGAS